MRSRLPVLALLALVAVLFLYLLSQHRGGSPGGAGAERARNAASGSTSDRVEDGRPFGVALLLTGPISDDGWNASAHEGLERAKAQLAARTGFLENLEKSRFEEAFRQYAAEGFDLIVGHGYEFQDAALRVAPDFPKATFLVIAGNRSAGNVSSVAFRFEEATFALGALSAWLSKSGTLGLVGGEEIPSLAPGFRAFEAGAHYARPGCRVITKYVGSWVDVALAKEHANALIHQGADLIFQNADKAGLGVFEAAKESKGVYAFGSNKDQNGVAPSVILASAVIDVPEAIARAAAAVREGRFKPGAYALGVREGIVSIAYNPALASAIPDTVRARVAEIETRIARGEIDPLDPSRAPAAGSESALPDWIRR